MVCKVAFLNDRVNPSCVLLQCNRTSHECRQRIRKWVIARLPHRERLSSVKGIAYGMPVQFMEKIEIRPASQIVVRPMKRTGLHSLLGCHNLNAATVDDFMRPPCLEPVLRFFPVRLAE